MIERSKFLLGLAAGVAAAGSSVDAATMQVVNARPIDWETPLEELGALYTPNNVFFIRSHMGPPPSIDAGAWRLTIDGLVDRPLQLTIDDLKKFPKHEVPAVLQCSGNGRWFYGEAYASVTHPAGAQWRIGGVGNARWAGARVRDVLARAGVKAGARYSTNSGLDNPILPATPKFVRGIELEKLLDPDTILAYEMNGTPLPYYHGYPVRLLVPGWAADHSLKWLTKMTIAKELTDNFWTASAYRYPKVAGEPGKLVAPADATPITAMNVKSIVTSPKKGARVRAGSPVTIAGVAWSGDGAYATAVEMSTDNGTTWIPARLGESPGKFSWRTFSTAFTPPSAGNVVVMVRARDSRGAMQPVVSPWNPSGYLWNGIQQVSLEVAGA